MPRTSTRAAYSVSVFLLRFFYAVGYSQHQDQIVRRTETTTIEICCHTGTIYRAPYRGHIFSKGSGGVTGLRSTIETKSDAVENGTIGPKGDIGGLYRRSELQKYKFK